MELLKRSCVVCKSNKNNSEVVYEQPIGSIAGIIDSADYVHRTVICKECGLVYSSPILPPHIVSEFYATQSNYTYPQNKGKTPSVEQNEWSRRHEFIKKRFSGFKGKVLDIGCATGYWLYLLKSEGWDVLGIDPSSKAAELAKELYDVEVITGMFDANLVLNEGPFDLVILCQVLEHMIYPNSIISDISSILSRNGTVYIEVPNLFYPYVSMGYFTFEHVNYFTPATLTSLMENNGFITDKVETFEDFPKDENFCFPIASTYTKSTQTSKIKSDYDAAYEAVAKYRENSGKEIERLRARINFILAEENSEKIGIWGGGIHTSQLLSLTALSELKLKLKLKYIFDNDPQKHGKSLGKIEIILLSNISHKIKQVLDAIIISSKIHENEIYEQISYLEREGVRIYKLY